MDELQNAYRYLRENENKTSVEEEAEVLEQEVNNAIEMAKRAVKDILREKHADTNKKDLQQTSPPKWPSYLMHFSGDSHSRHSGKCNQRLKPLNVLRRG